ncbi:MAG: LysM peptidoglycan-binding domain-containing protein, partial [Sinomicrobium sp.]|nr:LysM peptidoglycan-binding domain-containing protein [Sinomicrobium sp.]
ASAEMEKREKPLPQLFETDSELTYQVKSGDYLGKIAKKYGISVRKIKQWNGLKSDKLSVGQRLVLYPKKPDFTRDKAVAGSKTKTYTVKAGDTLQDIAKKFPGISVQNIKDWNNISGDNLKAGTKLKMCNC